MWTNLIPSVLDFVSSCQKLSMTTYSFELFFNQYDAGQSLPNWLHLMVNACLPHCFLLCRSFTSVSGLASETNIQLASNRYLLTGISRKTFFWRKFFMLLFAKELNLVHCTPAPKMLVLTTNVVHLYCFVTIIFHVMPNYT